jgi:hypothetical protein
LAIRCGNFKTPSIFYSKLQAFSLQLPQTPLQPSSAPLQPSSAPLQPSPAGSCPKFRSPPTPPSISVLPTSWRKVLCRECQKDVYDSSYRYCIECHLKRTRNCNIITRCCPCSQMQYHVLYRRGMSEMRVNVMHGCVCLL